MFNNNPDELKLDETCALFFSDYEEADHKRETTDGVQTLTITDQDAYDARIANERRQASVESAAQDARIADYAQHQIDQDER